MTSSTPSEVTPPSEPTKRGRRRRRAERSTPRTRRWKLTPLLALTVLVAVAGATVIAYSPTAKWFSKRNQAAAVRDYDAEIKTVVPSAEIQLRSAERYNAALSSGALVAANTNVPTGRGTSSDPSLDYRKMLRTDSGMMARIQIPAIDVDLPIYHGTSQATLLKGAGHLEGTSLPVGGKGTHSVITAHSGLAEATMFTDLRKLDVGDRFTITTFGKVLTYQVTNTRVVEPEDTETLRQEDGKDLVTLVTCTPLGINTHRMLVTGKRVTPTPAKDLKAAKEGPADAPFPWFLPGYLLALLVITAYARWAGTAPLVPDVTAADTSAPAAAPARRRTLGGRARSGAAAIAQPLGALRRRARRSETAPVFDDLGTPAAVPVAAAAAVDQTSGLLTRAGLVEALTDMTRGAQHNGLAFLVINVDGHRFAHDIDRGPGSAGGAELDVRTAGMSERLRGTGRPAGLVARLANADFAVVRDDVMGAATWAEELLATVGEPIVVDDTAHDVPWLAVLVTTDGFHHDAEALVRDAEAAARERFDRSPAAFSHAHLAIGSNLFDSDGDEPVIAAPEAAVGSGLASDAVASDAGWGGDHPVAAGAGAEGDLVADGEHIPVPVASDVAGLRSIAEPVAVGPPAGASGLDVGDPAPMSPDDPTGWLGLSDEDYLAKLRAVRTKRTD